MDPILHTLSSLGLGIATNAVYDLIKRAATTPREQLQAAVQNELNLRGVQMHAETIINALVQNGLLTIHSSHLHANDALAFGSLRGAAIIGNNSTLSTKTTSIVASGNAAMVTQGNAQVRQNPDGSITFHVGEGSEISIRT